MDEKQYGVGGLMVGTPASERKQSEMQFTLFGLLLFLAAFSICCAILIAPRLPSPSLPQRVGPWNHRFVDAGMSESEVERLLGGPPVTDTGSRLIKHYGPVTVRFGHDGGVLDVKPPR